MNLTRPYLALFSRVGGATLLALSRTVAPLTGREVSRLAGASQPAVQAALDHLVDHGLVTVQPAGRANLYTLNRDHLAIPAVEAALGMRVTLADRIRQAVEAWHPAAIHLSIFGSMARGDGDIHSDIDLLIVRLDADVDDPQWRSQVALLQQDIERWTGNRAAPMDLSVADLKEMDRSNRPVLADIRKDGFLIHGREIDDLLLEHQLVRSVAGS